jgi:hypothetical protein
MTHALDSESQAVGQGADAAPPEPAALARPHLLSPARIHQYVVVLWDAAPGSALMLSTMISLVVLAALAVLLMQELTKRTVTITPLSILKELASDGHIPGSAAPWHPAAAELHGWQ